MLNGESIGNEQEEEIDSALVFEDIFEYENIPTDTVRLNAATVKQLFKDKKYNLKEVRKNKSFKPIKILLLPEDIKKTESSEEKKELVEKYESINHHILLGNKRYKLEP